MSIKRRLDFRGSEMTHFLQDILRQPEELQRVIELLGGDLSGSLQSAAEIIRRARHVYFTGIGASWNAAVGAGALFHREGRPVYLLDASELLYSTRIPGESVVVILSRSGRSAEILQLLEKARRAEARVVGITNFAEGGLAQRSEIAIVLPVDPDHGISTNTYVSLAAGATALAATAAETFHSALVLDLLRAIEETNKKIPLWREQLVKSSWLLPGATYYFLARGSSLASSNEAQLLWEEAVKMPAVALGTDAFRHGPQEAVTSGIRVAMWVDDHAREADYAVARDLRSLGAVVMAVGSALPADTGDLTIELPHWPAGWQFLMNILPAQLAAERLAALSGVDCDAFRYASYVVEDSYGLLPQLNSCTNND
jgi:glutamine---fructose-6-phosphate transaminase (isomerizing)